jgi:perosamine synthetase
LKPLIVPADRAAATRPIPLCEPQIAGNEWRYVKECLDTGWVSSVGSFVDRFEQSVAEAVGAQYGVAMVNGTAALHVALLVSGVRPDDEVLVPAMTFIAPANAVRYVGAWPVFVDAEPSYWQMDSEKVIDFLEQGCVWRNGALHNRVTGRRVRAIVPVHILGHPVDLDPILTVARRYGLSVVEDATESLGASYRSRPVGTLGDIACFSFNGNKLVTTGGGGMIVTNREDLARQAKYLSTQAKDEPIEYVHGAIGYNYRLTNVLAAIGVAQMERLGDYVEAKRRIARRYDAALRSLKGLAPLGEALWARSVFWMYTTRIDPLVTGCDSRELLRRLAQANIQTRPLWQPLHRSVAHAGAFATDCSVADRLYREALSLPCSVGLSETDQEVVIDRLRAVLHEPVPSSGFTESRS